MRSKLIFASALVLLAASLSFAGVANAANRVKGYTKKSGTFVMPYYKSSPNKSKFDNYSTKGNINPFTGKKGTQSPFKLPKRK